VIFPVIETDSEVQVDDKFRIWASKSYVAKGTAAISKLEIEPEDGSGFIDITNPRNTEWFLDWQYSTPGIKQITLRVTSGVDPDKVIEDRVLTIEVLTEADDKLLSQDHDLVAIESKILHWVPQGRSTFKYVHREAQKNILEWLWVNGYRMDNGQRIRKEQILDVEEFKFWSTYVTLRLIFNDLSNAMDDIFGKKAKEYENREFLWRTRAVLKVDRNGDGELGDLEGFDMTTRNMVRE
jgi:hypothetical protein